MTVKAISKRKKSALAPSPSVVATQQSVLELDDAAPQAEIVIRLENVSVQYHIPHERVVSLKDYTIRTLMGRNGHRKNDTVQALSNVSLEIEQGEIFGVIGRNGAGKSTLLKVLSRVLTPTRGRVWMQGSVAPLLEVGAGFHPELTGRENIFLNGALLGHSRAKMKEIFDEIVDFAEISDFIDAPLRTYSSGMYARLGFAAATAVRPDILLVDEVLAVGDARFSQKCVQRMYEFKNRGTTILLVSHSGDLIKSFCDRAVWLDGGQIRRMGEAADVVERYLRR
jgi:ABC-type polysaccharide/polyol phosphate transport system ATPase subunit